MSKRKSTSRAKLKATSQEEQILLWKEHFKNLLGKSPKVTDEPIMKIIDIHLDIKLGQCTQKELNIVLSKFKNRKAIGLDEIPLELWKTRKFNNILLRYCNTVYNQDTIDRWTNSCILPYPKIDDLGIAENYCGIMLTSMVVKIYNALLLNLIEPAFEKVLGKNQNGFQRNRSTTSQILIIQQILVHVKNLEATLLLVDFSKTFDSIHRGKMEQILLAYSLPKETIAAIMMH